MKCLVDSMRFLFIKCLLVMFKEVEGLRKCSVGHVRQCCINYMSKKKEKRKKACIQYFHCVSSKVHTCFWPLYAGYNTS